MLSIFFLVIPALVATGIFHQVRSPWTGFSAAEGPSIFGAGTKRWLVLAAGATIANDIALFSAAVVASRCTTSPSFCSSALISTRPGIAQSPPLAPWPRWSTSPGRRRSRRRPFVFYAVDYGRRPLRALRRHAAIHGLDRAADLLAGPCGGFIANA